jgi:inner membrane protein
MSRVIIDLAAKRQGASSTGPLEHPAGVTLPFDSPSDAALIIPEIRSEIRSGSYSEEVLRLLSEAVKPGDRVLMIGAGLGVVSTLIARNEGVDRVIAIEANTALVPYLKRVHELNDVTRIETLNAVLADGKKGRVPFFARRDLRTSSLVPHDRSWQQVMMVPFIDVNLVLKEERISLIVCDIPIASAQLLARAELDTVDRILVNCGEDTDEAWGEDGVCTLLTARGYTADPNGTVVLLRRTVATVAAVASEPEGDQVEPAQSEQGQSEQDQIDQDDDEQGLEDEAGDEADESQPEPVAAEPVGGHSLSPNAQPDREDLRPEAGQPDSGQPDFGETRSSRRRKRKGRHAGRPDGGREDGERKDRRHQPERTDGNRAGRLWWLIALSLLMAVPLILIGEIADNRAERSAAVATEIGATWGGAQTLTGPFLVIPVERRGDNIRTAPLVLMPEVLKIDSELNTELLRRGVFALPVYRGRHTIWLDIDPVQVAGGRTDGGLSAGLLAADEIVLWDEAALGLGIAEPRAIRGRLLLEGGSEPITFKSGAFDPGAFEPIGGAEPLTGIHARIGDPRNHVGGWSFTLELDGSQKFRLTPAGGVTEGRLRSDWPNPKFTGVFLPARQVAGEDGFEAEWSVPQLAHSLPQAFRGTAQLRQLEGASFGVEMLQPLDIYQSAQQVAKYVLLLIAMTFGAIFMMEKLATRRPHLAQYALAGAAQCVFFALFVSLAEQVGFSIAYALAAAATTALLTLYAWFPLRLGQRSGWLTLALGVLYGVVYLILSAEEQALLMGAVLAFMVVAATMWGTRNEDWSATFGSLKPKSGAQPPKD